MDLRNILNKLNWPRSICYPYVINIEIIINYFFFKTNLQIYLKILKIQINACLYISRYKILYKNEIFK